MRTVWYIARADLAREGNAGAIHSREDSLALQAYGFDVLLLSSSSKPINLPDKAPVKLLTTSKYPLERLVFELKAVLLCLRAGKRPDFVFFRGPTNLLLMGLFLDLLGVPFGMELNGVMAYRYSRPGLMKRLVQVVPDRFFMRNCRVIISVTQELLRLSEGEARAGAILAVSANGVNTERIRPCEGRTRDPRFALKIGYLGKCYQRRGHELAIDALVELKARGVEVGFKFVGGGPAVSELEERARGGGVEDHVEFLPEVPPERMSAAVADCELMWAYFDDWKRFSLTGMSPLKVWTYLAIGKPFILRDPAGVLNQFRGVSGIFWTDATTARDMADFLVTLVEMDREILDAQGEEGRRYVESNGTWTIHGRRIGEAIDRYFESVAKADWSGAPLNGSSPRGGGTGS